MGNLSHVVLMKEPQSPSDCQRIHLRSAVIAKEIKHGPRTIKKTIQNINFTSKTRKDTGRSKISPGDMRKTTLVANKMPLDAVQ